MPYHLRIDAPKNAPSSGCIEYYWHRPHVRHKIANADHSLGLSEDNLWSSHRAHPLVRFASGGGVSPGARLRAHDTLSFPRRGCDIIGHPPSGTGSSWT